MNAALSLPRRIAVPAVSSTALPLPGGVVRELAGTTMGTTWSAKLAVHPGIEMPMIQAGIERRLREVVEQMSTWEASSQLSRFNDAPEGHWQPIGDSFHRVLSCALEVARQSRGAFDPTSGAIVDAWGFGPIVVGDPRSAGRPSASALDSARATSGWQRIQVDDGQRRIRQPGGLRIDLSAIAKGFAVDQVARHVHALGIESCLVEIGGELRGDGLKPNGQPWWVELEQPSHDPLPFGGLMVALHELSVATSGDYRRYRIVDGQRLSHTIDPRTGLPISNGLASVTVLHRECMLADAWSTSLGVMGLEEGLQEANARHLPARFVTRDRAGFREHLSDPLKDMLA